MSHNSITPLTNNLSSDGSNSVEQHSSLLLTTSGNAPAAGAPSSSQSGCLHATVLSAYDLPAREPPLCVSITIGAAQTVKTGPPVQRHKDRNSFKFTDTSNRSANELEIMAPLSELYRETALVEIIYEKAAENKKLQAYYPLKQLKIQETTWLILHLDGSDDQNDSVTVGPTLRLHLTLTGPFRTEVAAIVHLANAWFGLVDNLESKSSNAIASLPSLPADPKYFLIPAVPVAAVAVVSAPVVIGLLTVGLPLILPIVTVALALACAFGCLAITAYCSTASVRAQIAGMMNPVLHALLASSSGQRLLYQTGPRPSPVQLVRTFCPTGMWNRLVLSLLIDFIGSASYLIPIAGEATDIGWAPLQTILIMAMYEDTASSLKYISFAEEILPFTDIVPTATLGWLIEFGVPLLKGEHQPLDDSKNAPVSEIVAVTSLSGSAG